MWKTPWKCTAMGRWGYLSWSVGVHKDMRRGCNGEVQVLLAARQVQCALATRHASMPQGLTYPQSPGRQALQTGTALPQTCQVLSAMKDGLTPFSLDHHHHIHILTAGWPSLADYSQVSSSTKVVTLRQPAYLEPHTIPVCTTQPARVPCCQVSLTSCSSILEK